MSRVEENLEKVRARIRSAAKASGRRPETIRLVAVTKGVAVEQIQEAVRAGQTLVGENRVQEAFPKVNALGPEIEWHLVGHLQTNKVKHAVGVFTLIHSVDSMRVASAIEAEAARQSHQQPRRQAVLIQVNLGGETQKSGVAPAEAPAFVAAVAQLPHLSVQGLMTIPPLSEYPDASRLYFRQLRELAKQCRVDELSMGMSADFEVAIEEGATLVRVGTAIFGPRATSPRPFEGRGAR